MNDIIKDFMSEGFTKQELVKYGIIAPMVLIALCLIASVL